MAPFVQAGNEAGRGAVIANAGALTATVAAAAPTKVEFDKVVADNVAIHAKLNELIGNLRTTNIVD